MSMIPAGSKASQLYDKYGRSPAKLPIPSREFGYRWYSNDEHYPLGRNFPSRLASMTAQLAYEGKTLCMLIEGYYTEGEYHWHGVVSPTIFPIRTAADYEEAVAYLYGCHDNFDSDWHLYDLFIIVPTSTVA